MLAEIFHKCSAILDPSKTIKTEKIQTFLLNHMLH